MWVVVAWQTVRLHNGIAAGLMDLVCIPRSTIDYLVDSTHGLIDDEEAYWALRALTLTGELPEVHVQEVYRRAREVGLAL